MCPGSIPGGGTNRIESEGRHDGWKLCPSVARNVANGSPPPKRQGIHFRLDRLIQPNSRQVEVRRPDVDTVWRRYLLPTLAVMPDFEAVMRNGPSFVDLR